MDIFQNDNEGNSYFSKDTVTTLSDEHKAGSKSMELTMQYSELITTMAKHLAMQYGENSQRFRNLTSALNAFLQHFNIAHGAHVGAELTGDFEEKVSVFLKYLLNQGRSTQTIRDRKSQLRQWQQLYSEVDHKLNNPQCCTRLQVALRQHLTTSGYTIRGLAREASISLATLRRWLSGAHPNLRARPSLERVEKKLKVLPGSLVKLVTWSSHSSNPRHQEELFVIPYRQRLAKLSGDSYALKDVPVDLKNEWKAYLKHKTTPFPTLKRSKRGMWRVRPVANTNPLYDSEYTRTDAGICPTASITWIKVSSYLGFLMLPREKGGLGITKDEGCTLAHLVNHEFVMEYINWSLARADGIMHGGLLGIAQFIKEMTHPETGFLTQKPQFGEKLGLTPERWMTACQESFNAMRKVIAAYTANPQLSRDPWDPIQKLVVLRNPLIPVIKAIENISEEEKLAIPGSVEQALLVRNMLLLQLLIANPLRAHNLQTMRYQADNCGNIFQTSDGAWNVRFAPEDFKNSYGAARGKPYQMQIDHSLWPTIEKWISKSRHILEKSPSDFLFISANSKLQGRPWAGLNKAVARITRRYIAECPGFGPHSFRHLVATTWLKANPKDYLTVAALLHDKLETVMANYSHLCVDDGFVHWRGFLSQMMQK